MPTVQARIPTDRARRYLAQLCRHTQQMSRMRHGPLARPGGRPPPTVEHVEWSDTAGTIRFAGGECTLHATADSLTVRLDARDRDRLRRLQDGMARRLETIGRRAHLAVHWQPWDPAADGATDTATAPAGPTTVGRPRPRRLGRTLAVLGIAAVAVLVHAGLLGGALATTAWATWSTTIVLVVILLTIITVGGHLLLGRTAARRLPTLSRRSLRHHGHSRTETEQNPIDMPHRPS